MVSLLRDNELYEDNINYYNSVLGRVIGFASAIPIGLSKGIFGALFSPHTASDTLKAYADTYPYPLSDLSSIRKLEAIAGLSAYVGTLGLAVHQVLNEPANPVSYIPVATNIIGGLIRFLTPPREHTHITDVSSGEQNTFPDYYYYR